MDERSQAGTSLCALAHPFLERQDRDGLAAALSARWSPECLALLLDHASEPVAHVAVVCLGLIGGMPQAGAVAKLLHRDSITLAEAAEDALWGIWFRAGGPDAQRALRRAVDLGDRQVPQRAVALLDGLIARQPDFAEAHHQRGLAYSLLGWHEPALRDARRAARLNPLHFAAWACQGNCHAERGEHTEALECYRAALRIHPRLHAVRQSIRELRNILHAS